MSNVPLESIPHISRVFDVLRSAKPTRSLSASSWLCAFVFKLEGTFGSDSKGAIEWFLNLGVLAFMSFACIAFATIGVQVLLNANLSRLFKMSNDAVSNEVAETIIKDLVYVIVPISAAVLSL